MSIRCAFRSTCESLKAVVVFRISRDDSVDLLIFLAQFLTLAERETKIVLILQTGTLTGRVKVSLSSANILS